MVQPASLETLTTIGKEVIENRGWDTILQLTGFSIAKGVFYLDEIHYIYIYIYIYKGKAVPLQA